MELRDQEVVVLVVVSRVNNIYPMELKVKTPGLAAWMDIGRGADLTHQELVKHPEEIIITTTSKGGKATKATLMTWRGIGNWVSSAVVHGNTGENGTRTLQ